MRTFSFSNVLKHFIFLFFGFSMKQCSMNIFRKLFELSKADQNRGKLISTCETYVSTEAVARRCSVENVFLKFFQYSQEEKVYWSFFFNKFAGLRLESLLIKEALVQVYSCEFCKTFKTIFFHGRNI